MHCSKLCILNWRIVGDVEGKYTCHKTNDSSVNDYVIVNEDILNNVLYFHVQQFMGHLSDHCSVSFSVKCMQSNNMPNCQINENVFKFPNQYKWDRTSIIRFQHVLNDNEIQMKIKKLENVQRPSSRQAVNNALQELNEIYMNAARLSLNFKRVAKNHKKVQRNNKKWFDKTLGEMKNELIKSSYLLQKFPNAPPVRKHFFESLKIYNKSRKFKARRFQENMINRLDELKTSNPQSY